MVSNTAFPVCATIRVMVKCDKTGGLENPVGNDWYHIKKFKNISAENSLSD